MAERFAKNKSETFRYSGMRGQRFGGERKWWKYWKDYHCSNLLNTTV